MDRLDACQKQSATSTHPCSHQLSGMVWMYKMQPLLAVHFVIILGSAGIGGSTAEWAHWRSRAGRAS